MLAPLDGDLPELKQWQRMLKGLTLSKHLIQRASKFALSNVSLSELLFDMWLTNLSSLPQGKRRTSQFYLMDSICQVSKDRGVEEYICLLERELDNIITKVLEDDQLTDPKEKAGPKEAVNKVFTIWGERGVLSEDRIDSITEKFLGSESEREEKRRLDVQEKLAEIEQLRRENKRRRWESRLRKENDDGTAEFDEMWAQTRAIPELQRIFSGRYCTRTGAVESPGNVSDTSPSPGSPPLTPYTPYSPSRASTLSAKSAASHGIDSSTKPRDVPRQGVRVDRVSRNPKTEDAHARATAPPPTARAHHSSSGAAPYHASSARAAGHPSPYEQAAYQMAYWNAWKSAGGGYAGYSSYNQPYAGQMGPPSQGYYGAGHSSTGKHTDRYRGGRSSGESGEGNKRSSSS